MTHSAEHAPAPITASRRLLLVHAHPDDETINSGATMAKYAAEGAHVTLVTCTRGERGEVVVPSLAHLAADRDDLLGEHRVGELAAAMAALGVADQRFLDEVGLDELGSGDRYSDSGMAWGPDGRAVPAPDTPDGAFALTDVDDAAGRLALVIREVRPQVVATYEPDGGYGHPDHVQAHRVAMRALELAAEDGPGGSGWDVAKVYWSAIPEGVMRRLLKTAEDSGNNPFEGWSSDGPFPPMVMPDELVTTAIDGMAYAGAKDAALRAHATQIAVDGPLFALADGAGQSLVGMEFYRLVKGSPAGVRDADGRERDLFAGLELG